MIDYLVNDRNVNFEGSLDLSSSQTPSKKDFWQNALLKGIFLHLIKYARF